MVNPSCPVCSKKLNYTEGEYGLGGHQQIFWTCSCGFREQIRCARCHEVMTLYMRNGISSDMPSPGFLCLCGFFAVPEVCS